MKIFTHKAILLRFTKVIINSSIRKYLTIFASVSDGYVLWRNLAENKMMANLKKKWKNSCRLKDFI